MDATGSVNLSLARQTLNFGRHFLEMCVSMCVGGAALNALVFAGIPALTGRGDLRSQFPELSLMIIAVLTVMLFRLDLYAGRTGHRTAHAGAH